MAPTTAAGQVQRHLPFRFWVHDSPELWWQPLLQCTPDWDVGLDAQNSAEVWLLSQLLAHPNRSRTWQDAQVIVLPLLPKTSLHAGAGCLGTSGGHSQRLSDALEAMAGHPAYRRRDGRDHVLLFNYWDAWGTFGSAASASRAALSNVSFGWHETSAAAWGMANHRHVGRCQVALPYVENSHCSARPVADLLAAPRPVPLFFSGSVSEFDTRPGAVACPNVARHAMAVRKAIVSVGASVNGTRLRSLPHNLRSCTGDASCEDRLKASAASDAASAQLCAVAPGDTPSTGRLYDAISCLCIPLIAADDVELPFPRAGASMSTGASSRLTSSSETFERVASSSTWLADAAEAATRGRSAAAATPMPDAYGVRLLEAMLLAEPAAAVRRVLKATAGFAGSEARQALLRTRQLVAYRRPGSLVASLALRELWESCLHTPPVEAPTVAGAVAARTDVSPPTGIAEC